MVGEVAASGKIEIDASGREVSRGFLNRQTHPGPQIDWISRLAPGSGHGVTLFYIPSGQSPMIFSAFNCSISSGP